MFDRTAKYRFFTVTLTSNVPADINGQLYKLNQSWLARQLLKHQRPLPTSQRTRKLFKNNVFLNICEIELSKQIGRAESNKGKTFNSFKWLTVCKCCVFCYVSVHASYWDLQPAGLCGPWWAGSFSLCLLQSHPRPPSHFSPTAALRGN